MLRNLLFLKIKEKCQLSYFKQFINYYYYLPLVLQCLLIFHQSIFFQFYYKIIMKDLPFFKITSVWGKNQKSSNKRLINIITGKVKNEENTFSQRNIRTADASPRKSINVFLQDNRSNALSISRNGSRVDITSASRNKRIPVVQSSSRSLALKPMSNKKYRTMVASSRRSQTSQQLRKIARKVNILQQLKTAASQKQIFRNRLLSGVISKGKTHSSKEKMVNNQQEYDFSSIERMQKQKQAVQNASKRLSKEKNKAIQNYKVDYQAFNYLNKVFEMPEDLWKKYVHEISNQKRS